MNTKILLILLSIHSLSFISIVNCEFFSAVTQLKQLSVLESQVIDRIEQLINEKGNVLERFKNEMENSRSVAKMNADIGPEDAFHPVEGFHRFKRLAKYRKLLEYLEDVPSNQTSQFPGWDEYEGSIEALIRLQKTYLLSMDELVNGIITSKNIDNPDQTGNFQIFKAKPLSANDCYMMAKHANESLKYYNETIVWAETAYRLAEKNLIDYDEFEINQTDPNKSDEQLKTDLKYKILVLFAWALKRQGYNAEAFLIISQALELVPESLEAKKLKEEYQQAMQKFATKTRPKNFGYESIKPELVPRWDGWNSLFAYEALCRGEHYLPESNYSRLFCFHLDTSTIADPYYKLWKIKVEEAGKTPHIVQFHDVIFEEEIEFLKNYATNQLKRATVGRTTEKDVSRSRVSQSAWGHDGVNPMFDRLTKRVQSLTGLDVQQAGEALQMGNYGLGGHYAPHLDHKEDDIPVKDIFPDVGKGNRIATWMFYLSDVTLGGATVFSSAGVTIWPRKGSAAFWYNLRSSGNSDPYTRHAGCPVLIGSKWVANKWIHEYFQEFKRPCPLKPFEFNLVERLHH